MKILVTSYDNDEQQWFHDIVEAPTADAAEEYICTARPDVIGADALPFEILAQWLTDNSTKNMEWNTSEPLTECQDCGRITPESNLEPIKDLHQRVEPGEEMPAGECPFCGALCQRVEVQP